MAAAHLRDPWPARLELRFERRGERTILAHRSHHGPLLVQRAFQPELAEAGSCHAYIVHPPGGVVSGDDLSLGVRVAPRARVLLTGVAAGKFYRSPDALHPGRQSQTFEVEDGELEWLPFESLYYPSAVAELTTRVELMGESRFIGWEIACLGLPAQGLRFQDGRVRQRIELRHAGSLLFLEQMHFDAQAAQASWGLADHAAFGHCLAYPAQSIDLERARSVSRPWPDAEVTLAWTLVDRVLCGRGRALRADRLRAAFIEVWSSLRASLLGRPAHRPRIWAT
ncbi:MAG TPA: urease accessory protein UreD [Steroidobacteraceae bacterium]|nr:urease accessory protein UreD [Steroidobacteraceae bacterium]